VISSSRKTSTMDRQHINKTWTARRQYETPTGERRYSTWSVREGTRGETPLAQWRVTVSQRDGTEKQW